MSIGKFSKKQEFAPASNREREKAQLEPMPLEPPDLQHLRAAEGFVQLGMYLDADAELDKIDPFCRVTPEVLAARLEIYAALRKWKLMQVVAKKLAEYDPQNVQVGDFLGICGL